MEESLGQIVKRIARRRNLNARTLGEKINKTKQGVADIFKRDIVDSDLLIVLSEALDYDFVAHLYEREPLRRFKEREIQNWQTNINDCEKKIGELNDVVYSQERLIQSLESAVKSQEDVIRLLKEKEKFLLHRTQ